MNDSNPDMGIETPPFVNDAQQAEDYFSARRTWTTSWGGNQIAEGRGAPLIHGKLRALRLKVGGLAAERKNGVMFPVKSAATLFQSLGQALTDLNMIAPVIHQVPHHFEYRYEDKNGVERVGTGIHITATVRVAAEDGSFVDFVGSGHGMDKDDKAGGKASTYAWKDALLKGLTIPEKDLVDTDDESGLGENRKAPGKKSAAVKAPTVDQKADALAKIAAAATPDELRAVKDSTLVNLPPPLQEEVSPAYKARMTTLKDAAKAAAN